MLALDTRSQANDKPHGPALQNLMPTQIPEASPVRLAADAFIGQQRSLAKQVVPPINDFIATVGEKVMTRSMRLEPADIAGNVDFAILHRGADFPGDKAGKAAEHYYSQGLAPATCQERVVELLSVMALRRPKYSTGYSARFGCVNIKVYRGLFPLWCGDRQAAQLLLVVAPTYIN